MKIVAIIQARVDSTRLPGKVLKDLAGKTVLQRVVNRVRMSKLVNEVIVATTVNKADDTIVQLCGSIGLPVFRGSENDVLDRFCQAAKHFNADQIVRITSDCPLIDPRIIDMVISRHLDEKADLTSNALVETFPDGEDVEILSFKVLERAWREARLASDREHVTTFIKKNGEKFKIVSVVNKEDISAKRWTLDNAEDYQFLRRIYEHFKGREDEFGMEDVLAVIKKNPKYETMNRHIQRNAGYQKSLREDREVIHG